MQGARRAIKFSAYINQLFSSLNEKLREAEFPPGCKERLVVKDFVNMGLHDTDITDTAFRKGNANTADAETNTD